MSGYILIKRYMLKDFPSKLVFLLQSSVTGRWIARVKFLVCGNNTGNPLFISDCNVTLT